MSDRLALDPATIEQIAAAVVARLTDAQPDTGPALIDAAEVARRHGVTRSWAYDHAADLGAVRLGASSRARLRFDPDRVAGYLDRDRTPALLPDRQPPLDGSAPPRRSYRSEDEPREHHPRFSHRPRTPAPPGRRREGATRRGFRYGRGVSERMHERPADPCRRAAVAPGRRNPPGRSCSKPPRHSSRAPTGFCGGAG